MKEGWKMVKLGEICETTAGGTPSKTHKEYYEGGKIPWMLSGEVCQKYIYEVEHYITSEGLENSSAKLFPINSVVVAMYGATAGQVGILKIETSTNQAVCGILPNDKMSPEFLYYYFLYYKDILVAQAVGNAQPNISQQKIKAVEIPLLSLEEQHRIVGILDAAFAKIDVLKANAEANLANAKALFQQVLAQELQPKEGWETKRLDEIATFYNGKAHEQCIDENGEYILVNSKYISSDTRIGKHTSNQLFPLYKDDIVMVMSDVPNGKALAKCLIIPSDGTHSLNQRICVFRYSKINVRLLYYLINRNPYLLSFNNGENQTNLRKNDILKMQLSYPTNEAEVIHVLKRLDEQIYLINALIENKEQTIRECDALKQSILRQAFSGEL